ncbi:unnamed protein product, partial [Strongylus vulgaris]
QACIEQFRIICTQLECTKNGKKYKEGEEFTIGNLRYKCQKYGVYTIEGCISDHKKNLKIGDVVVINNIKSQCLAVGPSVFYRETVCGILGQPECDKIGPPKGYEEACKKEKENPQNAKELPMVGLPPGWKAVDLTTQNIPGTNKRVLSQTLMFNPIAKPRYTHLSAIYVLKIAQSLLELYLWTSFDRTPIVVLK